MTSSPDPILMKGASGKEMLAWAASTRSTHWWIKGEKGQLHIGPFVHLVLDHAELLQGKNNPLSMASQNCENSIRDYSRSQGRKH